MLPFCGVAHLSVGATSSICRFRARALHPVPSLSNKVKCHGSRVVSPPYRDFIVKTY